MKHDHAHWVSQVREMASRSLDRSTKTGCVIVSPSDELVAFGCNSLPNFAADKPERHERPAKYLWFEHAERNAFYKAAREGLSTNGCALYVNWCPCVECCRAMIQSGIREVYCGEPTDHPKYGDEFDVGLTMLREAGVAVEMFVELSK